MWFFIMFLFSGCGAVGSARRSGRRGRKFESSHPDYLVNYATLFLYTEKPEGSKVLKWSTANLGGTAKFHNAGLQRSSLNRIPFELVYSESFDFKSDALKREV
jgi:hypothetical protein